MTPLGVVGRRSTSQRSARHAVRSHRTLAAGSGRNTVEVLITRLCVGIGVMERVKCQAAGDREAEAAVVELVEDLDGNFVRVRIPEERDLEASLVAVREFFELWVRHECPSGW